MDMSEDHKILAIAVVLAFLAGACTLVAWNTIDDGDDDWIKDLDTNGGTVYTDGGEHLTLYSSQHVYKEDGNLVVAYDDGSYYMMPIDHITKVYTYDK